MQKVLAIARREIGERSFVFVAAIGLTIAPALALVIPRGTLQDRLSVFAVLSLILAVGFTGGLSTIVGVSLVGRELTEKRLSFYFSRPVSGAQIWFGKLLAAIALVAGCAAIVFLPSVFFFPAVSKSWATFPLILGYIAGVIALLFAIGHTLSTMIRSRSVWLVFDFIAAVIFVIAVAVAAIPLLMHHAQVLVGVIVYSVLMSFVATVAAGGAWQLSRGRIDVVRNHRELSKFLWTSGAIVLAIVFGYTMWVSSAGPGDLRLMHADHAPNGSWLFVEGTAKHRLDYETAFFHDVKSGTNIPVPMQFQWIGGFDRNGAAAMWIEPANPVTTVLGTLVGRGNAPMEIVVTRLAPGEKPRRTGIYIESIPRFGDITTDLSRAAIVGKESVSVYDLNTRKSLGSARVGTAWVHFATPDLLWVFERQEISPSNWVVRVSKFDIPHHSMTKVFETTARGNGVAIRLLDDERTLIVRTFLGGAPKFADPSPALRLFDVTTGQQLPIPIGPKVTNVRASGDGHLLVADGAVLKVYSGNALQREITIPEATSVRIAGDLGDGHWLVAHEWGQRKSDVVDINNGTLIAHATGMSAMMNSNGTPVFQDEKGTYVTWNWQTNDRKAIF